MSDYRIEDLLDEPEPDCECYRIGDWDDCGDCELHNQSSGWHVRQRILAQMLAERPINTSVKEAA